MSNRRVLELYNDSTLELCIDHRKHSKYCADGQLKTRVSDLHGKSSLEGENQSFTDFNPDTAHASKRPKQADGSDDSMVESCHSVTCKLSSNYASSYWHSNPPNKPFWPFHALQTFCGHHDNECNLDNELAS
jgi:hypothetical protein